MNFLAVFLLMGIAIAAYVFSARKRKSEGGEFRGELDADPDMRR